MENKVYCGDCKHKRYVEYCGYVHYECKKNPRLESDFLYLNKVNEKCIIKNRNNDCPDFEEKLSLWNWIVTKFPVL